MHASPLSTIILASGLALAQNTTNCPNNRLNDQATHGRVNSTGTTPFTWNTTGSGASKPWHMSILVNQTGNPIDNGGTISWPYLSVPNDVEGNACVYSLKSQNSTATDANCGGVFSAECSAYILEKIRDNSRNVGGANGNCGSWSQTSEELARVHELCGELDIVGFVAYPNVSNETCAIPSLSGVELPDNYVSKLMGISLSPFNDSVGAKWDGVSDDAYDLTVVQSKPFAVVASQRLEGGQLQTDVQLVCVTPNNTQPGSRVVENKTPWGKPSSGASVAWGARSGLSAVVAGVAVLLFTL